MRAAVALAAACLALPAQQDELEDLVRAQRRLLNDWGGLVRYGSENAELKLDPAVARVVFLGDDITERWGESGGEFFPGKPYFNRGIEHQTTPQLLVRFRQDVIGLKPRVVVIQAGMNDFAGYTGPATQGTIAENLETMTELAKLHGIRVVLASLTPVCDCVKDMTSRRPVGKILGMNEWIEQYAVKSGAVYADLYRPLVKGRALERDYTVDGWLLNDAGYARIAPVLEKAIEKALGAKP